MVDLMSPMQSSLKKGWEMGRSTKRLSWIHLARNTPRKWNSLLIGSTSSLSWGKGAGKRPQDRWTTDFLSAWTCMTLSAHSIMASPRGTLTRSCFRRPTRNSAGSSRRAVAGGRERSMVASRRFCSHTMALRTRPHTPRAAGVLNAARLGLRRLPGHAQDLTALIGRQRAGAQPTGTTPAAAHPMLTEVLEGRGTPRMEVPEEVECAPSPRLALVLKVAGLGTTREVELPLANYKATIFCYVQKLLQLSCSGAVKTDKLRRIWEPTYT
ncbi:hypothetical protein CRUP_000677 [Coryphaenoides rupestris]|nr:hypothetical protein CRUP_000677 [Coryphaenoides rupestris]